MHQRITQKDYQRTIQNFINLSIDKVNVIFDPKLLVGGFSLIHIIDDRKKQGKILGLNGALTYQNKHQTVRANVNFIKNSKSGKQFQENAEMIKKLILGDTKHIKSITLKHGAKLAKITFSDNSQLIAENTFDNTRPLSYDDDRECYSVYFGEKVRGDGELNFFRTTFSRD